MLSSSLREFIKNWWCKMCSSLKIHTHINLNLCILCRRCLQCHSNERLNVCSTYWAMMKRRCARDTSCKMTTGLKDDPKQVFQTYFAQPFILQPLVFKFSWGFSPCWGRRIRIQAGWCTIQNTLLLGRGHNLVIIEYWWIRDSVFQWIGSLDGVNIGRSLGEE